MHKRLKNTKQKWLSYAQFWMFLMTFSSRACKDRMHLLRHIGQKCLPNECKVMQSFIRLSVGMIDLFSGAGRINQADTSTFSLFPASPVPSILFSHTCLNLLRILIGFFPSDANDYFASCPLKVIACERALQKALSVLPLVRTTCKLYLSPSRWRDPPSLA